MQLTRIDRWLRERFVYEIHVYTLRPPEQIPQGIVCHELPEAPGRTYRFRFVARQPKPAEHLITFLKDNNLMFTTRVVERSAWYVPFIAPKDKSIVFWLIWSALTTVAAISAINGLRLLWLNPDVRANVTDALKILKK